MFKKYKVITLSLILIIIVSIVTIYNYNNLKIDNKVEMIAAYIDGTKSSTIPGKDDGYVLDTTQGTNGVICTNNATGTWDTEEWGINIRNATQSGTRCDVYFKTKPITGLYDTILAAEAESITAHGDTAPSFIGISETDEGMYKSNDGIGDVYYYRGAVEDNYVSFAGFCWRIVRTNGDHSVRLIYQGTTCTATGDDASAITSQKYNTSYKNNMYVGYMYTSGQVHGTGTSSNAKIQLESWYETNLSKYDSFIADQIFCNDRQPSTSETTINGSGGTGTTTTYYAPYIRAKSTHQPVLTCTTASDKFTKTATNGNRKLSQKVGMLTSDEAIMAGADGDKTSNTSYYLYTGASWWLGSPYYMKSSGILYVFDVYSDGGVKAGNVTPTLGLRPVISLLPSVEVLSGDGSQGNPWIVNSSVCDSTTCTLSDCGSYSSCSVTYTDETGTKSRTCTKTCTSAVDSSIVCSTDTEYQDTRTCNGSKTRPWTYNSDVGWPSNCKSGGLDVGCPNVCSEDGYSLWSCTSSKTVAPTSASLADGKYCWCAN